MRIDLLETELYRFHGEVMSAVGTSAGMPPPLHYARESAEEFFGRLEMPSLRLEAPFVAVPVAAPNMQEILVRKLHQVCAASFDPDRYDAQAFAELVCAWCAALGFDSRFRLMSGRQVGR